MRKVRETYHITKHDLLDQLGIAFERIVDVRVLVQVPALDEECLEITVELAEDEE